MDRVLYKRVNDCNLYISEQLQELWPNGFSTVGDVTFESAAYVARYITKKITGKAAEDHYDGRLPEFITMSRREGIGTSWFDKYKSDVYPSDEVVLRGKIMRAPRYYDKKYEVDNEADLIKIKEKRKLKALAVADDNTPARLKVKESCKKAQFQLLKRGLEKNDI